MTALHKKPIADLPLVNEPANIPTLKATPPPSESPNIRLVTKEARDYISALWDLCFNQAQLRTYQLLCHDISNYFRDLKGVDREDQCWRWEEWKLWFDDDFEETYREIKRIRWRLSLLKGAYRKTRAHKNFEDLTVQKRGFTISGNEAPAIRDILKRYDVERAARHLSSEILGFSDLQRLQSNLHEGRYYYIGSPHMTPDISLAAEIEELQMLSGSEEFVWLDHDIARWTNRARNGFVLDSNEWKERQPAAVLYNLATVWCQIMLVDHDNAVTAWKWLAKKRKAKEIAAQQLNTEKESETAQCVETRKPWAMKDYLDAMEHMDPEHFLTMIRNVNDLGMTLQSAGLILELEAMDDLQLENRNSKELMSQTLELEVKEEETQLVRKPAVHSVPCHNKLFIGENTGRQGRLAENLETRNYPNPSLKKDASMPKAKRNKSVRFAEHI